MGTRGQLRKVEDQLIKDLEGTTIPFWRLGKKYGVSKQAVAQFMQRKGINRPKRDHTENCSICRGLLRIAKKPHGDFISSRTIKKVLGIGRGKWLYHLDILRKKGLISQKFGRLQSKKVERAYQIYFTRRLPVSVIGKQVGLKNFHSTLQRHRTSGWDVPRPDGNDRRSGVKKKRKQ